MLVSIQAGLTFVVELLGGFWLLNASGIRDSRLAFDCVRGFLPVPAVNEVSSLIGERTQ